MRERDVTTSRSDMNTTSDHDLTLHLLSVPISEREKVYKLLEALADNLKGKYGVCIEDRKSPFTL